MGREDIHGQLVDLSLHVFQGASRGSKHVLHRATESRDPIIRRSGQSIRNGMRINLGWWRLTFGALPGPPVQWDLRAESTTLTNTNQWECIMNAGLLGEARGMGTTEKDVVKLRPLRAPGICMTVVGVGQGGKGVQGYEIITLNKGLEVARILSPMSCWIHCALQSPAAMRTLRSETDWMDLVKTSRAR